MAQYIPKSLLVAEINKRIIDAPVNNIGHQRVWAYNDVKDIINTLKVKEVDLEIQPSTKIDGWVARQPEGDLWLFSEEPYYNSDIGRWGTAIGDERELENCDTSMFKDLNFFDETIEVELIIKLKAQKGEEV